MLQMLCSDVGEGAQHLLAARLGSGRVEWRASGCWIALYIYYSTRGLREAIHEAAYCAMLC